jgi:hypothetical protein
MTPIIHCFLCLTIIIALAFIIEINIKRLCNKEAKRSENEYKKKVNSLKAGDKYYHFLFKDDPFKEKTIYSQIISWRFGRDNNCYVLYKFLPSEYSEGCTDSDEIESFLRYWKKCK